VGERLGINYNVIWSLLEMRAVSLESRSLIGFLAFISVIDTCQSVVFSGSVG